jgi:hypothetical protein
MEKSFLVWEAQQNDVGKTHASSEAFPDTQPADLANGGHRREKSLLPSKTSAERTKFQAAHLAGSGRRTIQRCSTSDSDWSKGATVAVEELEKETPNASSQGRDHRHADRPGCWRMVVKPLKMTTFGATYVNSLVAA